MANRKNRKEERRLRVRTVRRDPPDLRKLAGALIELARAQAEKDAEQQHHRRARRPAADPSEEKSA